MGKKDLGFFGILWGSLEFFGLVEIFLDLVKVFSGSVKVFLGLVKAFFGLVEVFLGSVKVQEKFGRTLHKLYLGFQRISFTWLLPNFPTPFDQTPLLVY